MGKGPFRRPVKGTKFFATPLESRSSHNGQRPLQKTRRRDPYTSLEPIKLTPWQGLNFPQCSQPRPASK